MVMSKTVFLDWKICEPLATMAGGKRNEKSGKLEVELRSAPKGGVPRIFIQTHCKDDTHTNRDDCNSIFTLAYMKYSCVDCEALRLRKTACPLACSKKCCLIQVFQT